MTDLVVVTPDGAYPLVLEEFLNRAASLGVRSVSRRIIKDPLRDSSGELPDLLRPFLGKSRKALAIRDLEGSGWEERGAVALEEHLLERMHRNGWASSDCAAIVVPPEIEAWLRLPSTHLDDLMTERARRHREWTTARRHQVLDGIVGDFGGCDDTGKPCRPKEVFEEFLRQLGIPRSNAFVSAPGAKGVPDVVRDTVLSSAARPPAQLVSY
ncbi:MAG: hypothetical protein M3495_16785 [Pseudomonadota bacterium]|nr:hypothetical protein [Pseudomonadota bacterium]